MCNIANNENCKTCPFYTNHVFKYRSCLLQPEKLIVPVLFSEQDVANIKRVAGLMGITVDEFLLETVRASVDMMLDTE